MESIIFTKYTETEFQKIVSEAIKAEIRKSQPSPEPEPIFITRQETAALLGISLVTLHFWTKDGKVPAYRIGSRVRFKKSEVVASLNKIQT